MRNLLACIILGLGLAIICADAQGLLEIMENIACFFTDRHCKSESWPISNTISTSQPTQTDGSSQTDSRLSAQPTQTGWSFDPTGSRKPESSSDVQLEKVQETLKSKCSNKQRENNLYCSVVGSAWNASISHGIPTETTLKGSVDSFQKLLDNHTQWNNHTKRDFVAILPLFMDKISLDALSIALENPGNISPTVVRDFMVIKTKVFSPKVLRKNETLTLNAQGDQMVIHPSAAAAKTSDTVAVAFISYDGLESLFQESLLQNKTLEVNKMVTPDRVNSRLVSVSVKSKTRNISTPVNLTFKHLEDNVAHVKVLCVHLNSDAFSDHGCQHLFSNITHTECSCQHLSSFAVLMATAPKHGDLILTIISYLGLSISVICLFLCIVTFLFCRSSHNSSTFIHLQLSFCLFFADLLFLIGINKTNNKILCSVIAGTLKYLFLACFVWMFLEGVNLYFIVRNLKVANYSGASKYMKISMYLIGYGFPILIVAICAAIKPGAFGTPNRCWLNPDFIWSFVGPICAIIVVNLVFFCLILKNLHKKLASLNSEISSVKNTRSLIFKAIAHVFILGVTWCFGLFQHGPLENVMAYMFTIFNSVQGIFIFLVHCLLNQKVRESYRHWICCIRDSAPDVSDIVVTSFPVSNPSTNEPNTTAVVNQKIEWGNPT